LFQGWDRGIRDLEDVSVFAEFPSSNKPHLHQDNNALGLKEKHGGPGNGIIGRITPSPT
jgi:hypothetical protein